MKRFTVKTTTGTYELEAKFVRYSHGPSISVVEFYNDDKEAPPVAVFPLGLLLRVTDASVKILPPPRQPAPGQPPPAH